jgi:hypothetical protein
MPAVIVRTGDYLADVTALEAAGADSVWLHDKALSPTGGHAEVPLDTWIVLGAMAAITRRIRLGSMIGSAAAWPPGLLASAAEALGQLSSGRVVVGVPAGSEFQTHADSLMAGRADLPRPVVLVACDVHTEAERYALLADGVILVSADERRVAAVGARIRELPAAGAHNGDFELWVEVPIPANRADWAETVAAHEAAGATGIIVSWDPRLIDLLRNAGEPDDRTDLLIATG